MMRSYNTDPVLWDADPDCEHEWITHEEWSHRGSTKSPLAKRQITNEVNKSCFCSKCGCWKGELGAEPTVALYIKHLVAIFDEVKRVLRKDGTCFVNLADKYGGSGNGSWNAPIEIRGKQYRKTCNIDQEYLAPPLPHNNNAKSLLLIPERFAIAMTDNGWILRNVIIWHKNNSMPESVKDRFSRSFEYIYFFTKNKRYYFEQQFEPLAESTLPRMARGVSESNKWVNGADGQTKHTMSQPRPNVSSLYPRTKTTKEERIEKGNWQGANRGVDGNGGFTNLGNLYGSPLGRNARNILTINTRGYKGAHFATFNTELIKPLISAGCPEFICTKCGKPREKIYDQQRINTRPGNNVLNAKSGNENDPNAEMHKSDLSKYRQQVIHKESGYTSCGCDNPTYDAGIVIDPFAGTCTTAIAAKQLNRHYLMIELKPEYIKMGEERIAKEGVPKPKRKTKADKQAEYEQWLEERQLELF